MVRTTVTLDPDVEALVRRHMRERGVGFKQALNDLVREGLPAAGTGEPFRTEAADLGTPTVNLDRALQLVAEVEDEEIVRKVRLAK